MAASEDGPALNGDPEQRSRRVLGALAITALVVVVAWLARSLWAEYWSTETLDTLYWFAAVILGGITAQYHLIRWIVRAREPEADQSPWREALAFVVFLIILAAMILLLVMWTYHDEGYL